MVKSLGNKEKQLRKELEDKKRIAKADRTGNCKDYRRGKKESFKIRSDTGTKSL
jgi:hypothetical protein